MYFCVITLVMPEKIQLEIDAADAPDYIEMVQHKRLLVDAEIERKQAELNELISKSAQLGFTLEKLQGVSGGVVTPSVEHAVIGKIAGGGKPVNGYNPKGSIWDKVQYVLKREIEPVTKRYILDTIISLDPKAAALEGKRRRQFSISVSACLTTKTAAGLIYRIESEIEDNKYSLPVA